MLALKRVQNARLLKGIVVFSMQVRETAAVKYQTEARTGFNRADSEVQTGEQFKQLLAKMELRALDPGQLRILEEKRRSRLLRLASTHQLYLSDSAKEALLRWTRGDL